METKIFFKDGRWYYSYKDERNFRHVRLCRNCSTREEAERFVSKLKFLNELISRASIEKESVAQNAVEQVESWQYEVTEEKTCAGKIAAFCVLFDVQDDKFNPEIIKETLINSLSNFSLTEVSLCSSSKIVSENENCANVPVPSSSSFSIEKSLPAGDVEDDIERILSGYYVRGSVWLKYDEIHGSVYSEKVLRQNHSSCLRMKNLLSDVGRFSLLTRSRLHKLQEELLELGLTGKSVNNNITVLHKVVLQLIDKDIIEKDPFVGLRRCAHEKSRRTCFPVQLFDGFFSNPENADVYELLAYCAIVTGARRGELMNLKEENLKLYDDGSVSGRVIYTLLICGTKSKYSVRKIALNEMAARAVRRLLRTQANTSYNMERCTEMIGKKFGYTLEKLKEEGIVFHSFRKMFKTILTTANLNTTAIEYFLGHSTDNQSSNDVERIYFVPEKADFGKPYFEAIKAFDFLVKRE